MNRVLLAGITYFALVMGAGFILGTIRVPFLVPRLGERYAELIEMPIMLAVIAMAARLIVNKFNLPTTTSARLGTGFLALALSLGAELMLAAVLQDRSLAEYLASRDPVSGGVYLVVLGLFALMPLLLHRPSQS